MINAEYSDVYASVWLWRGTRVNLGDSYDQDHCSFVTRYNARNCVKRAYLAIKFVMLRSQGDMTVQDWG
jgi:hypothetical protein